MNWINANHKSWSDAPHFEELPIPKDNPMGLIGKYMQFVYNRHRDCPFGLHAYIEDKDVVKNKMGCYVIYTQKETSDFFRLDYSSIGKPHWTLNLDILKSLTYPYEGLTYPIEIKDSDAAFRVFYVTQYNDNPGDKVLNILLEYFNDLRYKGGLSS